MAEELKGPAAYSYNLQTETPIDIDASIYMLAPEDLPLLQGINADGVPILSTTPTGDVIFYWLEENVPLPRATLAAALTDGVGTSVTVGTAEAVKFRVGDQIRIDDEIMIVTDLNTTTEVLTVTRGTAAETNTTGATHVLGSVVMGMGSLLVEGAVGAANFQGRDKYSNYCQIFSTTVQMSRTEQSIKKYGIPSELAHQMVNAVHHSGVGQEHDALYGVKFQHATNFRRQTGGLKHFVTTNIDAATKWLTVDSIQDMQQLAFNRGGRFDYIMAAPTAFDALNNTSGSERIQTVMVDDARRGRQRALTVNTEYGPVTLVRNRWCRPTEAFAVRRAGFSRRMFQPTITQKLAKTDDTDKYLMVAEWGFQVKGQDHMGIWTGLDVNSALPGDLV